MTGRTVVGTTDCHRVLNKIDSLNFVTEAAGRTVAGTTGRHRLRNPDWVGFVLKVLRGVWTIPSYDYKVSGLMLIIQLLGG